MPINAGYEFFDAEKNYLAALTMEDKLYWLEEMIRKAPKHKSSENFLAELKTRLKKLKEKAEIAKKKGKGKKGIRKEGYQIVLLGKTNSGKSSLLGKLTNANPLIGDYMFTTKEPEIGTMEYEGVRAQVIDVPSIGSEDFDSGLVNNADCLLIIVDNLEDIPECEKSAERNKGDKIIVVNKTDLLDSNEKRKLDARCRGKRLKDFLLVSSYNGEGIEELKKKIFEKMRVIRVYTKEPGKAPSKEPIVLEEGSTVKDVAESIFKGFSNKIKESRLTGPSAKFANQKVGLQHKLKDRDVVEFHTK